MIRDRHLAVLGLSSHATKEEVSQAYLDLSKVWHPDRFAHDPRLHKISEEKMKEINAAHDYLANDSWLRDKTNNAYSSSFKDENESHYSAAGPNRKGDNFQSEAIPGWSEFFPSGPQILNLMMIAVIVGSVLGMYRLSIQKAENDQLRADAASLTNPSEEPEEIETAALLHASHQQPSKDEIPVEEYLQTNSHEHVEMRLEEAELLPAALDLSTASQIEPAILVTSEIKGNVKDRDKMYVLAKGRKVTERIINQTPDIVEASIACDGARVKELLQNGADANAIDTRGETGLIWAVKRGCGPVVEILLKHGGDIHHTSDNGFSAYVWARVYGNREMSELLVKRGAKTLRGVYWWRNESDQQLAWQERTEKFLCKNGACDNTAVASPKKNR